MPMEAGADRSPEPPDDRAAAGETSTAGASNASAAAKVETSRRTIVFPFDVPRRPPTIGADPTVDRTHTPEL